MSGTAEKIYESLSEELLLRWLEEGKTETLHLEFKTAKCDGSFVKDDRKNLAKGISAFANSEGGVILWGAQDKQNSDGEKMLAGFVGFEDVTRALRRIEEFTGEATSAPAPGVVHKPVEVEGKSLIATLVPPSEIGPHMAKLGEDRYYQRSGASSRRMEHFQIADMFGRRPQPVLEFDHRVILDGTPTAHTTITGYVVVGLRNSGRGIARYPCLYLRFNESDAYKIWQVGLAKPGHEGLPFRPDPTKQSEWRKFAANANQVIYPDSIPHEVYQIRFDIQFLQERDSVSDPLTIQYRCLAEGCEVVEGEVSITRDQIRDRIQEYFDGGAGRAV